LFDGAITGPSRLFYYKIQFTTYQTNFGSKPMEETYTYQTLVQFLYHEMPAADAVEMAHTIEEDDFLHAEFNMLLTAKAQLPKVHFSPSKTSIGNILQYSAKTALEAQC
jgi:hypothetical protein